MKLYATIKNNRGGKKSTGDDTRILVTLSYGNRELGTIGLYSIVDKEVEGYRIVWDKGVFPAKVIEEMEKGKKQKDAEVPMTIVMENGKPKAKPFLDALMDL